MSILPKSNESLLVRTEFSSDEAWQQLAGQATRENEDGFRAYAEPVSDRAFDAAGWETVKAAVPAGQGASVLFIADGISFSLPDHPILVVDLSGHVLVRGGVPGDCRPDALPVPPVRVVGC